MNWVQIAKMAIELMIIAEEIHIMPKQGKSKKEFVKGTAWAIVDSMGVVSTGGRKENWGTIDVLLDPIIDLASRFMFPKEV